MKSFQKYRLLHTPFSKKLFFVFNYLRRASILSLISFLYLLIVKDVQAQNISSTKPYWEYVRTETGIYPYSPDGCYQPTVHKAEEGFVDITVKKCSHPNDKKEVKTRLKFEWVKPPHIIPVNEPISHKLTTTLIENSDPEWVISGNVFIRYELFRADGPYKDGPYPGWAGGQSAVFGKGSPNPVILEFKENYVGGWDKFSTMRITVVASYSNQHWWSYVYRYVIPEPKSDVQNSNPNGYFGNATGTYITDFQEMTLQQNANKVTGTYKYKDGRIEGILNGRTLTGWWYQYNGKGRFIFEFNPEFNAFTGKWGDNDAEPTQPWNGRRVNKQTSHSISHLWKVIEKDLSNGQYYEATWRLKDNGLSFDAHWKHLPSGNEGDLSNFAHIRSISNNQIIIDRPGLGTYQGTISNNRMSIKGTLTWCSGCSWEVKLETPLPRELR